MTGKKILLIDDTPVLAQSIADMLQMEGFIVKVSHSGKQAFEFLRDNNVDLIITDLRMQGMDGFEIARAIRNSQHFQQLPVIILTADTNPENEGGRQEAGANLLLHKPFDEENLLKSINQIITRNDK